MATITRKQIENYYEKEWSGVLSAKTVNLLIELTCQSCNRSNHSQVQAFVKNKELPKAQALGQI